MSSNPEDFNSTKDLVSVRYMVDDVDAASASTRSTSDSP